MPARLRQSAGQPASFSEAEKLYDIPGLNLTQSLSWRPGKAIPVADLLGRLENLSSQLRAYDEDQVDSQKFTPLAQDLANPNLLGHKDKGVRAWAISCVVDVLKTCAPEAPFLDTQLKDVFTVIINSILPALADPTNAYNVQYVYILHSLSESQSILLLGDIENPEQLMQNLFTHAFDLFAGSASSAEVEVSKSVEYHLKGLLCTVVEEIDLPTEVTDIIISQFLRVDIRKQPDESTKTKRSDGQNQKQATLLLKDYPPAYNLAKSICTTCQERMTAQVTQYFYAIILDSGILPQANGDTQDSHRRVSALEDSEDEVNSFADLRKAHGLLKELWRACPDILINVIPQVEAELSADSIRLRQLVTHTLGDLTAGVGIAGLAPSNQLDAAAYPLPSVSSPQPILSPLNPLLAPASPKPFPSVHRTAYQAFLGRRNDKAPRVRETWAQSAARVLFTAAGGIGLSEDEQQELLSGLAQTLQDPDDRVRIAAIKAMFLFDYHQMVTILGADGGLSSTGTVFSTLADRFTDRKHHVREEAISLGAKIWGVASRDLEEGNENVTSVIGDLPNRLFGAYYTNDKHVHEMLYSVMYESLLPISFPPIKAQSSQGSSQRRRTRDAKSSQDSQTSDPDSIRARRILTLVRGLDPRSKQVFFGMQLRQTQMCKAIMIFLKACETYNGGVMDDPNDEEKVKKQLTNYIETLSKQFLGSSKMSTDLWKFAEIHNRRDYQLIRFAIGPEHDYRTMQKAIKELNKRIKEGPSSTQTLIESLNSLLNRSALVVYNRSHVPAVMNLSRTDEHGLANTAHEILREISSSNPEVLKTHIQALCRELEETSPSATRFEEPNAADTLKACAHFARKYPGEVSKDRKFLTALTNFALYSKSPTAAKHAVSVALTAADRKEMYARDILTKALNGWEQRSPHFLSRVAAVSQIYLLAPAAASAENETTLRRLMDEILRKNHTSSSEEDPNAWDDTNIDEGQAKELALRAMVNRLRGETEKDNLEEFDALASSTFEILMQLVTNEGEISSTNDTPPALRNRLRLVAARLMLKLCSHRRRCEELVSPTMFISLALIVINPPNPVRAGFTNQLKKYLGQNKLSHRWFTVLFLLAFEPDEDLRSSTLTWLRSRSQFFERQQQQQQAKTADKKPYANVMESVFARLLSLMVHHPDYPDKATNTFDVDLQDFSKYIVFYLAAVATEENLSLVFHIAQRVKQTRDNIPLTPASVTAETTADEMSERLYVLSDLAQAIIRNYADMMPTHAKGVNLLQTWPGTVALPKSLFRQLPNQEVAREVAGKNYLPEETAEGLERLVREYMKSLKGKTIGGRRVGLGLRKRKTASEEPDDDEEQEDEDGERRAVKKKKVTRLPVRKTPKGKKLPAGGSSSPLGSKQVQPSRKSSRVSKGVSYADRDSEVDDEEMEENDRLAASSSPAVRKSVSGNAKKSRGISVSDTDADGDERMIDHEDDKANGVGVHVHEDAEGDAPTNDLEPEPEDPDLAEDSMHVDVDDEEPGADEEEQNEEEDEDEDKDEEERETTPSPLKEKKNVPTSSKKSPSSSTSKKKPQPQPQAQRKPTSRGKGKDTSSAIQKTKKGGVASKKAVVTPGRSTRARATWSGRA